MNRRASLCVSHLIFLAACWGSLGCQGSPSGFNQIQLSAVPQVVTANGTSSITASVTNDPGNGGVSWTLTGAGALSGATKTSVTYTAPASITAQTTISVNAQAVDFASQKQSIQITLEPPVAIATTSLPGGNFGSAYTGTVNATGGIAPFSWTISAGSLTPGLSLGASNSRSVLISGTPTQQTNSNFTAKITDSTGASATQPLTIAIGAPLPLAVSTTMLPNAALNSAYPPVMLQASGGVPPFSWALLSGSLPPGISLASDGTVSGTPTQAGTFTFQVSVTDREAPPVTATSGTLSLTVQNLALVSGNYAFQFNGFDSKGKPVVAAGSFTADGAGNITNGVEDVNSFAAAAVNRTFTGSYTLESDNRGLLSFSSLVPSPVYSFSINAAGSHGRIIEFDSSGTRGSGDLEKRTLSTCTAATFNGNYAFGLSGQQVAVSGVSAAGPDVIVGAFPAAAALAPSTTGTLGLGELDANTPLGVKTQSALNGSYQATVQPTRCSLSLIWSVATMNFSVYPISPSEAFLVETDTVGSTTPILTSGTMSRQIGAPFSTNPGSTFTANSVGALAGLAPSGSSFVPDVALVVVAGTGASSFTFSSIENSAGTITPALTTSNFQLADILGRVGTTLVSPFTPTFYMISQNTAYVIASEPNFSNQPFPLFGMIQTQTPVSFTASAIAGTYLAASGAPTTASVPNIAGTQMLTDTSSTAGTIAGTQDRSTALAMISDESVVGTYAVTSAAAGAGTFQLTAPTAVTGAYIAISPTELTMITTTPGDANPVVLIFEQ